MQILSIQDVQPDIDTPRIGQPLRSPTLHLSTITKDMLVKMDAERFGGPMHKTKIEMGWALEYALSRGLLGVMRTVGVHSDSGELIQIYHPGEFVVDGVTMSPDLVTIESGVLRVEEIKCTWMSCRQELTHPKFWHYIVQLKAYCRAIGTTEARLRIFFVNGNYSRNDDDPENGPLFRVFTLRFTELELEENWSMLINHAVRCGMLMPVSRLIH